MNIKTSIEPWEGLPKFEYEKQTFHLQRRIFQCSLKGDLKGAHRIQKLLIKSQAARYVAVSQVSERNKGRDTAGIDGLASLNSKQKWQLLQTLRLDEKIKPVRQLDIPKPGTDSVRTLGIPTIRNRALQALIVLALEPQWEAKLSPRAYGFRKGRSVHDAILNIRTCISWQPKWVLDADIEKFFDRVNQDALLRKLDTYPTLRTAVRRILRSGALKGSVFTETLVGTPQGGPLSPLLANIAIHGMAEALAEASIQWNLADGKICKIAPITIGYADDFIVLHKHKEVIERSRTFIEEWLKPMGLNLHPGKTQIVHTLEENDGPTGFDFLGCHIRQFRTGKYAKKKAFKQIHTQIKPSKKTVTRIYQKISGLIETLLPTKPNKGKESIKGISPEALTIIRLNAVIKGWSNAYNRIQSTETFARLDHLIWYKMYRRLRKRHQKMGRRKVAEKFLRSKEGKWVIHCEDSLTGKCCKLAKFTDTKIRQHTNLQFHRSYFDGDVVYWGTRLGRYTGTPGWLTRKLKLQHGRCSQCKERLNGRMEVILTSHQGSGKAHSSLVHVSCRSGHSGRESICEQPNCAQPGA